MEKVRWMRPLGGRWGMANVKREWEQEEATGGAT